MPVEFTTSYITEALATFRQYKKMGERAMEQVPEERLFHTEDEEVNSIALIVKHMAGNMRSRWTDFLTSDGEKPDRNRDSEFEDPPKSLEELMRLWDDGWKHVFAALEPLSDAHLSERVLIRGEAHSVMQAITRQLCHYATHIGQIVLLAKMYRGGEWQTLSMPRRKSAGSQLS